VNPEIVYIYLLLLLKLLLNFLDGDLFILVNYPYLSLMYFQLKEVKGFRMRFSIQLISLPCLEIVDSFGMAWLLPSLRLRSLISSFLIFLL
jgi:hypothetical protein